MLSALARGTLRALPNVERSAYGSGVGVLVGVCVGVGVAVAVDVRVGVGVSVAVGVKVGVSVGVRVGVATTTTTRAVGATCATVGVGLFCKEQAVQNSRQNSASFFMQDNGPPAGTQDTVPELDSSRARSKKLLRGDQVAN